MTTLIAVLLGALVTIAAIVCIALSKVMHQIDDLCNHADRYMDIIIRPVNAASGLSVGLGMLALVWAHFVADFLLQNDKMAINKSKSVRWLGLHVIIYTIPFFYWGWKFAVITGIAHFVTDWITSKGTSWLWAKGERHWFFSLIGFDQAIHISTLVLTMRLVA